MEYRSATRMQTTRQLIALPVQGKSNILAQSKIFLLACINQARSRFEIGIFKRTATNQKC